MKQQNILHWPRLDTVLMVEQHIKDNGGISKKELWRTLPRKVMYQTYKTVIDYLIDSKKVMLTKDDKLVWIFADNHKAKRLIDESVRADA